LPRTATVPRAAGWAWCLSLPWEVEWNGDWCIEFRIEAAAARDGTKAFEPRRRLRSERVARVTDMVGRQISCMMADVDVLTIKECDLVFESVMIVREMVDERY
jgi:hypothetical protein